MRNEKIDRFRGNKFKWREGQLFQWRYVGSLDTSMLVEASGDARLLKHVRGNNLSDERCDLNEIIFIGH